MSHRGPSMRTRASIALNCVDALSKRDWISPVSFFTASASSRAVAVDVAASPASSVASLTLASLHPWMLALKFAIFDPALNSPNNPAIMKIHPMKAATFASSTGFSRKIIEYLKRRMLVRAIESMSYINSGPSSTSPPITAQLNIDCLKNHTSLAPIRLVFAHSFSFATRSGGNIEPYPDTDISRARALQYGVFKIMIIGYDFYPQVTSRLHYGKTESCPTSSAPAGTTLQQIHQRLSSLYRLPPRTKRSGSCVICFIRTDPVGTEPWWILLLWPRAAFISSNLQPACRM